MGGSGRFSLTRGDPNSIIGDFSFIGEVCGEGCVDIGLGAAAFAWD